MDAWLRAGVFLVVTLAIGAAGCGGDPPVIETISPVTAGQGTEITLVGSGFSEESNDVAFHPTQGDVSRTGYLNGLASSDGATLTFGLPDGLSACPTTEEVCELILLPLSAGEQEVFVVNEDGESNRVTLTVAAGE
jgi:hypothetical protein